VIIKKFTAKTEAEAIALAQKELGDDIMIMTSRYVKPKGLFAFLRKKQVEITVAKEEEAPEPGKKIRAGVSEIDALRVAAEKAEKEKNEKEPEKEVRSTHSENYDRSEALAVEEKLDNIQSLLEQKLSKDLARKEAEEAKKEEPEKEEETDKNKQERIDFLKLLYNTMIDNEVGEQYANEFIDEVEKNFSPDMSMETILAHVYQKIILKFGKTECITPADHGAKVVFFIGPTGVGKTTTLAKLASKFCLNEYKKVALFTTDTYRISATDQLKTYAGILGVPFHIIYTTEELKENYERYKEYDYILVDTAGHSHKNEEQRADTEQYLHALDEIAQCEKFLVLSATTKYKDLLAIADAYRELTSYKLIFTKLDETTTYGNLLNVRLHTMAALSYVTNGQNVPDDIEVFNAQGAVKKLLGGSD
jgi:flagellar biosynthesis protein FlhF